MAERLKPKPGGASSREDKTETDVKKTAGRQRATGIERESVCVCV